MLVDETTSGGRFRCMMMGAAYKRRCIPLIWRCYKASSATDYPREGQVEMIATMLGQLKAVAALSWCYLFRVVKTVKIKTASGPLSPYAEISKSGEDQQYEGMS